MNTLNKYFLAGTVALTGMVGLTACSSDSESTGGEQGGVAGQTVKTQFALNVPYASNGTRMTENNTQGEGNNFLGISRMRLFTFTDVPAVNQPITSKIFLGSDNSAFEQSLYKYIYRDIDIPVGTKYFTLYGTATETSSDMFEVGALDASNAYAGTSTNLGDINFSLRSITNSTDISNDAEAQKVIAALQKVIGSEYVDDEEGDQVWAQIGQQSAGGTSSEQYARNLYKRFIKLKAGSAKSVVAALKGLKEQTGVASGTGSLLAVIAANCDAAISDLENVTFPRNRSLPDGVAQLSYDEIGAKFSYQSTAGLGANNNIAISSITYPASLTYFVSTKSMVSDKALISLSDLPDYQEWTKDPASAWTSTGFTEGAVTSSTRSIGLYDALQYGVAAMKLSIKCSAATLKDNASRFEGNNNTDADITVPSAGYPVTAVLVGGQPAKVGWNFLPNDENEKFANTIYDDNINNEERFTAKPEQTPSNYNYTLVLDNKTSAAVQNVVYVTVELENTGAAFYGADGLVPVGGKFYLVGKLDVTEPGNNSTTLGIDHVFVQDHTTNVNLTFGSLKSAYNCIPDLRSSLLSLGLAVDLQWKEGITFDVTIE